MKSAAMTLEERAREWLGKTVRKSMIAESNALYEVAKDLSALLQAVRDEALEDFMDCCRYDPMMSGPLFKGYDRSALDRLRAKCEAIRALAVRTK